VDVVGDVEIHNKPISRLPRKFGRIEGNFRCWECQLTTLEGCPEYVKGYFNCGGQNIEGRRCLSSLKGGPREVAAIDTAGEGFYCWRNNLVNLDGGPEIVGGTYDCGDNKITSLSGCPKKVGMFNCSSNMLINFEDAPEQLTEFFGHNNPLKDRQEEFRHLKERYPQILVNI
jgi:hypothetical protein